MVIASLVVAVVAILIAGASAAYTRKQATEQAKVTAIEQARRHEELTPQLNVTCRALDAEATHIQVDLELAGPAGLAGLDEVTVRVRDDMPDRKPSPGSQLTQEQVSAIIWGPYRIMPGLKDTDANGRAHGPFNLPKNEPYPIPLERSYAPSWVPDPGQWRKQYDGKPVRLEITCKRDGDEPWVVLREAEVQRRMRIRYLPPA